MNPAQFRLTVRVNPNTSRRRAVPKDDFLKVNLTVPPEDGRANRELRAYLAEVFGIDVERVHIVRGEIALQMDVLLEGLDRETLVKRLGDL